MDETANYQQEEEKEEGRPGFAGQHRIYLHVISDLNNFTKFDGDIIQKVAIPTGSKGVKAPSVTRVTTWPVFQTLVQRPAMLC